MRLIITCLIIFCFFKYGVADEPIVFIESPASKTEFCKYEKIILTGKCFFETENFVKHEWESETDGLIADTKGQFAMLELIKSGEHAFIYRAWTSENEMAKARITLKVFDLPDNQIEARRRFFTRLFGRQLPQYISVVNYNPDYTYQWFFNNMPMKKETDGKIKVGEFGRYRLEITSDNGCKAVSEVYEIIDN